MEILYSPFIQFTASATSKKSFNDITHFLKKFIFTFIT